MIGPKIFYRIFQLLEKAEYIFASQEIDNNPRRDKINN